MVEALTSAGIDDCTPDATLYIWQKVPDKKDSVGFAKKLLAKNIAVVVTPGKWISKEVNGTNPGENYVRFALVPTLDECRLAAERISKMRF